MVKLKKALKKLAKLGAAKPAKKGTPEKKKSGPVPAAAKKKATAPAKSAKKPSGTPKDAGKKKAAAAKPAPKKADVLVKAVKGKKGAPIPAAVAKKANGKSPPEPVKGKRGTEKASETAAAPKGKTLVKTDKPAEKGRKASKDGPTEVDLAPVSEAPPLEDEGPEEVILTDAEGRRYCRVKDCDQISTVDGYCRYHYLLFWKKIQVRKKILTEGKLERYIEDLTARYPDKYLEMLRKDLKTEKDFLAAITELEIDESGVDSDYEDEAQSYLEEVRGMGGDSNAREEEEF